MGKSFIMIIACVVCASSDFVVAQELKITRQPEFSASCLVGRDTSGLRNIRKYNYRQISMDYDSLRLSCFFGEMMLASSDSVMVDFSQKVSGSEDSYISPESFPYLVRSKSFPVDRSTALSIFRILGITRAVRSVPPFIADTVCWALHLMNSEDNSHIATLDSVGYYPQQMKDTTSFPQCFDMHDNSKNWMKTLSLDLSRYAKGSDPYNAYLAWNVKGSGKGVKGWFVSDGYRYFDKWSTELHLKTRNNK